MQEFSNSYFLSKLNRELGNLKAEDRIARILELSNREALLTTSFGFDSSVMLHLVTSIYPEIPVIYIDHGCWVDSAKQKEFVDYCRQRFRLNLFTVFPKEKIEYSQVYEAHCNGDSREISSLSYKGKKEPLERALKSFNPRVFLTGISRDETPERQELDFLIFQKTGRFKASPILDWSKDAKQEYTSKNSLPKNPFYFDIFKGLDGKKECGLHTDYGVDSGANI